MSKSPRFFVCGTCGNLAGLIEDHGPPMSCCGAKMTELVPNTAEASVEKHVPVAYKTDQGIGVKVGSVLHPMEKEHYIGFVYVRTDQGGQRKNLSVGDLPEATFSFSNDKPLEVYAYCNLHGLWKAEI